MNRKLNLHPKTLVSVLLLSVSLSACVTTGQNTGPGMGNAGKGAIIGGVAGAVLGKATGDHDNDRLLVGGAGGALIGAAIGAYMDKQQQELQQTLQGSGIDVTRQDDKIILNMPDNITFDYNKADIKPQAYPALQSVSETLRRYDRTEVHISGHTDSKGSDQYNQSLSERRANSVRESLLQNGVRYERIKTMGYGEQHPVADNATEAGRAQNRRVEMTLIPIPDQPQGMPAQQPR